MTTELETLLAKLIAIKQAADGRIALFSNQGQAMDGFTELANYRSVVGQLEDMLEEKTND